MIVWRPCLLPCCGPNLDCLLQAQHNTAQLRHTLTGTVCVPDQPPHLLLMLSVQAAATSQGSPQHASPEAVTAGLSGSSSRSSRPWEQQRSPTSSSSTWQCTKGGGGAWRQQWCSEACRAEQHQTLLHKQAAVPCGAVAEPNTASVRSCHGEQHGSSSCLRWCSCWVCCCCCCC